MRRSVAATASIVTLTLVLGPAALAADPCVPLPTVLRWESTALAPGEAAWFRQEVARIWRALGVDVQWVLAGQAARVVVSVSDGQPCGAGAAQMPILGCVQFRDGRPHGELRVSATAALDAAATARLDGRSVRDRPPQLIRTIAVRLLGRAAAHELGHYLLGPQAHAATGLMRPAFDPSEALRPYVGAYGLDRGQIARARARLAERD